MLAAVNTIAYDSSRRMIKAANDLRMVQISFADEPEEKRREYLAEALDRALEEVLPDERKAFLAALKDQFPNWSAEPPAAAPAVAIAVVPEDTPAPAESREAVMERVIEQIQLLDDEDREVLVARLQQAGVLPKASVAGPGASATGAALPKHVEEAAQHLMHKLALTKLDLGRAIKLMVRLVDQTGGLDQLMWNAWRVIAPRSAYRRPADLHKEMIRYMSGDREISGQQLVGYLERYMKLTASLIAGVGQLGAQFARSHLLKFSPQEIEAKVASAGGGLLVSKEYKCWERYVELSHELDQNTIEHAIRETIAQKTEALLEKSSS
jgi:hypothetical protein